MSTSATLPEAQPNARRSAISLAFALFLLTVLVFSPAVFHDFVNFDDDAYMTNNPNIANGLTVESFLWSWTAAINANWHPVTWLSHALDVSLFGLAPWGHHLVSILLHALSVALLFLWLLRATGSKLPSLLVALLFSVHPLRVESVAWVAERKDVLCFLFAMCALLAYDAYARRNSWKSLAASLFFFALSLMSKPMLVTLPCLLLLLDTWPYRHFAPLQAFTEPQLRKAMLRCALEKTPFVLLALASVVITLQVQESAMRSSDILPISQRMGNALLAYWEYVALTVWPSGLSVLYPLPVAPPALPQLVAAGMGLALISVIATAVAIRRPEALIGWLWFLGTLVPVIGLVHVGNQSHADRYTYFPSVGLWIAMVFSIFHALKHRPELQRVLLAAGLLLTCVYAGLTVRQLGVWRNSETLFRHALATTQENSVAHNNLGKALFEKGNAPEALYHFEEACRIAPGNLEAQYNLGSALLATGDADRAIKILAPLAPSLQDDADYLANLGRAALLTNRPVEARRFIERALALQPEHATSLELMQSISLDTE